MTVLSLASTGTAVLSPRKAFGSEHMRALGHDCLMNDERDFWKILVVGASEQRGMWGSALGWLLHTVRARSPVCVTPVARSAAARTRGVRPCTGWVDSAG
jgi:hypothetical protein